MTTSRRKRQLLGSMRKQAGPGQAATPGGTGVWQGARVQDPPSSPMQLGLGLNTVLGASSRCCPAMTLRLAPHRLHTAQPLLGTSPQGERPKAHPVFAPRPPLDDAAGPPPLRHFCTRHGTFMSTKCGLTHALGYLLFLRPDRGPGGALKLGGEVGTGADVCFQYAANHGLFSCLV